MRYITWCACVGALSLTACDDSPKGADALAKALCDYSSRCAAQVGFPFSSMDGCRRYYAGYLGSPVFTRSIDDAAVPACAASLDSAPCIPTVNVASSPACHDAVAVETARVGEACNDRSCDAGTYCAYSSGLGSDTCPVCVASRAVDESCTYDFECQSRRCDRESGVCVPPAAFGEGCSSDYDCASGHCDYGTGTCDAGMRPDGESCTYDSDCQSGLCYGSTCTQRFARGATCAYDFECASDLLCVGRVCVEFDFWKEAAVGEDCVFFCVDGAWCPSHTEADAKCRPYAALGAACNPEDESVRCSPDAWCDGSGHCAAASAAGQPCTTDAACLSNLCGTDGLCATDACVMPAP